VAAVRAGQFDAVGVDVDGHGALAVVARQGDVACGAAPVAKGA
jgi:hypothetical protein